MGRIEDNRKIIVVGSPSKSEHTERLMHFLKEKNQAIIPIIEPEWTPPPPTLVPDLFIFNHEFIYPTLSPLVGKVDIIVAKGDRLEKVVDIENHYSNGFTLLSLEQCLNGERAGILKSEYTMQKSNNLAADNREAKEYQEVAKNTKLSWQKKRVKVTNVTSKKKKRK